MPKNIKQIVLWEDEEHKTKASKFGKPIPVRIDFNFPVTWTILNIEDLKQILRLWIEGEERVYPPSEGFKGRALLFEEIKKVFEEKP